MGKRGAYESNNALAYCMERDTAYAKRKTRQLSRGWLSFYSHDNLKFKVAEASHLIIDTLNSSFALSLHSWPMEVGDIRLLIFSSKEVTRALESHESYFMMHTFASYHSIY